MITLQWPWEVNALHCKKTCISSHVVQFTGKKKKLFLVRSVQVHHWFKLLCIFLTWTLIILKHNQALPLFRLSFKSINLHNLHRNDKVWQPWGMCSAQYIYVFSMCTVYLVSLSLKGRILKYCLAQNDRKYTYVIQTLTLNTMNTNTSMWSGRAGKSPHYLPRVQLWVILLNALQISPFGVGISPCYINTSIDYHSPTLHPPLLHHWYWSPLVSLCVIAVSDGRLSAHQIQLVVKRYRAQPILWKQKILYQKTFIQVISLLLIIAFDFFPHSYLDGDLL